MNEPLSSVTLPELLRAAARAYGESTAIVLRSDTGSIDALNFVDLERNSAELARGLLARGVGKSTRIGFVFGNGPEFAITLFAIARIGAIAIPISTLAKGDELVRILRQSDVAGLVVQRRLFGCDYVERLCDALPELRAMQNQVLRVAQAPYLRWVVLAGEQPLPAAMHGLEWLIRASETVSEELLSLVENEVHPTDQMIEIYTSGAMALPKGVKHNHGPVMFRAKYLSRALGLERDTPIRASLPMFWVGGMMMYLLPNLVAGAVTTCIEGSSTNNRMAMGSVLDAADMKALNIKPPFWALGMTETLGPYTYGDEVRAPERPLCAPIDHVADGYEIRIVDRQGQLIIDGEIGEMEVRGYAVTPGLHKQEKATHFTPDGYYRTGDLCQSEEHRVHFVGRDGDIIKTSGANVSPAEVEIELQKLDAVHTAYVVGVPDNERGQIVVAALIACDGADLDFAHVERQLRSKISGYKVPKAYLQLEHADIPMLPSNKVARRLLTAMLQDRLARSAVVSE